ncbi:hypothetical protein H8S51_011100 [Roseburia rectibacter]|jgi:hypothetical protein|uniref:hypothetical protein n=1 Tax=Roseburia rectibacter TaxID=2763062 RepID=UPI00164C8525|nr:hypothetical protein [Roseburia rectibacter]UMY98863.1 hypothetical protein H8S51_011100 [Roseburia rectibacter]
MELTELSNLLKEQNESGKGFQIHLNSGNLDEKSQHNTDVEFGDLYFTNCRMLGNTTLLSFGNNEKKPVGFNEEINQPLYPMEINSSMFIDIARIEAVEAVENFEDWFIFTSSRVINLYMLPQNNNVDGHRNVVTIGFIE